ncbi:serine/threonine protein kinase [Streptomyces sp. RS10V-4]|uniref:serine/threonine-protein kinase n=1 Tax=Streptomyces rhizoryzae TaxID=2932493 RepID=UPI002002F698|nr:serine/threonine-protein kinase [Streptomyces rhizoryzae]MCK7622807.1 serine/threonine protein kinase [Streptomyces rhizoryzae]
MSSADTDGQDGHRGGMRPLAPGDPRRIGPYALLGRLGAGGMGRVFLARSAGGRTVAVKVVHEEHAADPQFRARFRREIDAARRVGERYTAPVLDADPDAELPWVATGYVPGPSLEQVVRRYGPLPAASVHALADGLLRALQDIHEAGIVHRDLKPSNVMLTVEGPRVIDFGIARALDASVESLLTSTGMVIGSPGFMSPEQILGRPVGAASDVFTLGGVLMYAATGRLPFGQDATNQHAVMYRIVEGEPRLDQVPDQALRDLIGRCLTKDAGQRPDVAALLAATAQAGTAGPDGEWLPAKLVVALAQQAARLLDVDAQVDGGKGGGEDGDGDGSADRGGSSAGSGGAGAVAGAAARPEEAGAAVAPGPGGGATAGSGAGEPEDAQPEDAQPQDVQPVAAVRETAPGADRAPRRRRPWVVGVAFVGVAAVGGGSVWVLQPYLKPDTVPPAVGRSAGPGPGTPGTPSASASGKPSAGPSGGAHDAKDPGGATAAGAGGAPADATAGPGGGSGSRGASGGSASSGGTPGGGASKGTGGSGSGGQPAPGPASGGNAVPAAFVGTWRLTNPYAQQPGTVVISRATTGAHAVRLISDINGTGHCETVAELVSVTDGGSRIALGPAAVDQARSNGICGTADPSAFLLDDPSGIRHDVGPAHGSGYHYERAGG